MRPDSPQNRLAPINASVNVTTPQPLTIAVSAQVTLDGVELDAVRQALVDSLGEYFADIDDGVVRLTRVGALLSAVEGVSTMRRSSSTAPRRTSRSPICSCP